MLAATPLLAGCVTTQQRNERAKLAAKRVLASRRPLALGAPAAHVHVAHVALVRDRRRSAFVVEIANDGAQPAADVPIEVGVAGAGRRRVLNRRGGLGYFDSRVASIPPHERVRWVFVTRRKLPRDARPFAVAGTPDSTLPGRPRVLPSVASEAVPGRPRVLPSVASQAVPGRPQVLRSVASEAVPRRLLRVTIRNRGAVPQYGLPVYAFARRGGRYVAAGRTTVEHLGTRATATISLSLVGAARGGAVETEVLPSIFH